MEEPKVDHITLVANKQPVPEGIINASAKPRLLRRATSRDRDAESAYDQGFSAPREGDLRHRQVFHGWRLLL
jgi:hypothetical protein